MKAANQLHPVPMRTLPRRRTRPLLLWSGILLCLIGILTLTYCGYVLFEARIYQAYQSWRFEQALKSSKSLTSSGELPPSPEPAAPPEALPASAEDTAIPESGDVLVGRIEISRIGMAEMIMEGIDNRTLRHAVGHIPGTALPGLQGNIGIAGHRDTFFRGLQSLRKEDEITLTTLHGSYRYRVDYTMVVEPRELWVLKDTGEAILTLVTCYPFDYVGPSPQRFIVRARKIPG
jgi:sortase A